MNHQWINHDNAHKYQAMPFVYCQVSDQIPGHVGHWGIYIAYLSITWYFPETPLESLEHAKLKALGMLKEYMRGNIDFINSSSRDLESGLQNLKYENAEHS